MDATTTNGARPSAWDLELSQTAYNTPQCPGAMVLSLLEDGADSRGLAASMLHQFWCFDHDNQCAQPIFEHLIAEHRAAVAAGTTDPSSAAALAWIDAAVEFALDMAKPPHPLLRRLLRIRPSALAHPARHPLVLCVRRIAAQDWPSRDAMYSSGLFACMALLLKKFAGDASLRAAVPYAYEALARWVITDPQRERTAAYIRHWIFRSLLETTGVHPDAPAGTGPLPLRIEVENVVVRGARDLRCIGELLSHGAEVLDEWQGGEENHQLGLNASLVDLLFCILIMTPVGWGDFVDDMKGGRYWICRCLTELKHRLRLRPEEVEALEVYDGGLVV